MNWKRRSRLAHVAASAGGAFVLCALGACSSNNGGDYSQTWSLVSHLWQQNDTDDLRRQVAAIPYATIGLRFGDGPGGILVLATHTGGVFSWMSAAWTVDIADGRVVRTIGFRHDVFVHDVVTNGNAGTARAVSWLADFPDLGAKSISVSCDDVPQGADAIEILNVSIPTIRVVERCKAPEISWNFVNRFWIDPQSHAVWRSEQFVHPKQVALDITTLRPALQQ